MNILVVVGTRPEAIKMSPLILQLQSDERFSVDVCATGQHREMLDQVFDIFQITPEYDLKVMTAGQSLSHLTSKILVGMEDVIASKDYDFVLVHGDTTTCFGAALAAFYLERRIGHVEAGLRTGDLRAPYPEEANRVLASKITDLHFSPTEKAVSNLIREGIDEDSILLTGNTVIDALKIAVERTERFSSEHLVEVFGSSFFAQHRQAEKHILVTGHRRESFGEGFRNLCSALREMALEHPNWLITYPVHLNPNVQKPVYDTLAGVDNISLMSPMEYLPFVWLMNNSDLLLTDSGGIQEEAPSLGKPVLVTRDVTERPEAIEAGTAVLVGTDVKKIKSAVSDILGDEECYERMSQAANPYGDGNASIRIAEGLAAWK